MSLKGRRRRKTSPAPRVGGRRVLLSAVILAAGVIGALAFRIVNAPETTTTGLEEGSVPADQALAAETDDSAAATPLYPYSIIPGGAETVEELEKAIDADPVVAAHFAAFDLSRTRVETLDRPRAAYVSYRNGQDVFWTRKPVVIPAGERVLTDGTNTARVRCGNCLSDSPGPVSADEPPAEVLDTPEPHDAILAPPSDPGDGPDGSDPSDPGSGGPNPGPSSTPTGGVPVGPGSGPAPTTGGVTPPGGVTPAGGGSGGSPGGSGSGGPSVGGGGGDGGRTAPGPSGGPSVPGTTGTPPGGDPSNPGTSPGPHAGPLPPPGGFPPGGSGPGGPGVPPGPDGNWPPPGGSTWPPGGPSVPPGPGDFPGPSDPDDPGPGDPGPGDPGDPFDDPPGGDDPKSIPEPGMTALMLLGAAWIARRKLRAR